MGNLDIMSKDYQSILGDFHRLPNINNIEQFIASFFFNYDDVKDLFSISETFHKSKKVSILNYSFLHRKEYHKEKYGNEYIDLTIESDYDSQNEIIYLNSYEENFLNDSFFRVELERIYDLMIYSIKDFYEKYKRNGTYTLINYLKDLKVYQSDNFYGSQPEIHYKNLNRNMFNDMVLQKRNELISDLEQKISFLEQIISKDEEGIKGEVKKQNKNGGLVLSANYKMTSRRAERICKWLKEEQYICKMTNFNTLNNIFVKSPTQINTKVVWTGYNHELKYFIELLHKEKIIYESAYQKKWSDVVTCFLDKNNNNFENRMFSKNPETPIEDSCKKIKNIVTKIQGEFTG